MAEKNILMIVGDYGEDYEIMVPYQSLQMVGHQVDTVCPEKKAGEKIITAVHDDGGAQTFDEKPGHKFSLNASFNEVEPDKYDALVLPGGRAPEYLRTYSEVIEYVEHFIKEEKPIAAVCHAMQLLVATGEMDGRNCTCVREVKADAETAGINWNDNVTVDENLVTAQTWEDHPEWLAKYLNILGTHINHS